MSNKIEEEKVPAQQPQQIQKIFDEDDDDFEEFEQEDLEVNHDLKIDVKQWREDWNDEDLTDEFSIQLKQELAQK
ncbi:unnamed protein product [Paramecium sonneborni]|uniref:Uncharacterized protein n=1 Tax=Paramecium sonneborni TaxID=65129 RepID=A0A8S1KPS7_9CILI|nr:unnamed protein product [Paramecium sonneborni]